jgi:hypothetical protein
MKRASKPTINPTMMVLMMFHMALILPNERRSPKVTRAQRLGKSRASQSAQTQRSVVTVPL